MARSIHVSQVEPSNPGYPRDVDRLRARLGAPRNPTLFPPHFLKSTFPKIGGRVVEFTLDDRLVGVGFLFPRGVNAGRPEYTLRFHPVGTGTGLIAQDLTRAVMDRLPGIEVVFYDPTVARLFSRQTVQPGPIEICRPDPAAADAVRELQQTIWAGEPDYLYPSDIHAPEFGLGTSLVGISDDGPAGFLFGFRKFGGSTFPPAWAVNHQSQLRIESQLLGVLPEYRQTGLAARLKWVQADEARRDGIDVINWTVDPLQFANAVLNLGRLRAVAFDFYPNYYEFRNELNRVPASRLNVTWLVRSDRVTGAATSPHGARYNVTDDPRLVRLNDGPVSARDPGDAPRVAIEIPGDWTTLQRTDPDQAVRWRTTTDRIFAQWLGGSDGKYILTDIGREEHRCYLIGQRVDDALLEALAT